jgi:hypothetical protein
MLDEREVATLESIIRRMTLRQRSGLEAWLNASHYSYGWHNAAPLWPSVVEAQEYAHSFEEADEEAWGPAEEQKQPPRLTSKERWVAIG